MEVGAGAGVEVVDVGPAGGEHQHLVAGEGGGPPVGAHRVPRGGRGIDASGCGRGRRRLEIGVVDVPAAELGEGVAFPGFVLASVLGEAEGSGCVGRARGGARRRRSRGVGGDRRRARPSRARLRRGRGCGRVGGCRPCRLRRRRARCGAEAAVFGVVEVDEKAGDGVAGDAGGGFEFGGGACRERGADDVIAGALPGVAGGVEAERLAGPGRGDHDIDRASRGGERDDQPDLLIGEARTRGERREHVSPLPRPPAGVGVVDGVVDESGLEREEFVGRVPGPVDGASIGRRVVWCRIVPTPAVVDRCEGDDPRVGEGLIGELLDRGDVGAGGELLAPGLDTARRSKLLAWRVSPSGPRSRSWILSTCSAVRSTARPVRPAVELVAVPSESRRPVPSIGRAAADGSMAESLASRVSRVAYCAARGEVTPRAASSASISCRRVENSFRTGSGIPSMSAMPVHDLSQATPSRTVSSCRSWARRGTQRSWPAGRGGGRRAHPTDRPAAGRVRDEDVGVEVRVSGPARPVPEPGADEPLTAHCHDPVGAPPGPARVASR